MGKTIMVVSGKGGTGKSSTAFGVASAIASLGHSVVCVDLDLEFKNLDLITGMSNIALLDFYDVMYNDYPLSDAIYKHPDIPNFHLLSAPVDISASDIKIEDFRVLIGRLRGMFEYCFIDCPAGVGMEFELAASICESAIIIATSDAVSLRDAQRVNLLLVDRNITDAKLILNRFSPKLLKKTSVKNIDNAIDNVGSRLLGIVPEDPVVLECQGNSLPVILHEKRGASRAYFNIANRILGKRVELLEKV